MEDCSKDEEDHGDVDQLLPPDLYLHPSHVHLPLRLDQAWGRLRSYSSIYNVTSSMLVVTAVAEDDGDGQDDGEDNQVDVKIILVILVGELSRLE